MTAQSQLPEDLPSFRLDGRLAVITGAGDGIGRTFARAFANAGAEVVLVSRTREKLLAVQSEVQASGGRAHIFPADVSKLRDIESLAKEVSQLAKAQSAGASAKSATKAAPQANGVPPALILVNCAGYGFTKSALETTEEDWDRLIDTQLKGTFFCCQAFGQLMVDSGYGKIINLSSTWSESTDMGKSVYGAAKAGISYLTAALSTEWAPLGVRVNAIAPTSTLSENTARAFRENPARARRLLNKIKLGRFAEPSDLVGAAIFLASPASDFVTGHTLFVDGGWRTAL